MLISNSCRKAPKYSDIPLIEFEKMDLLTDGINLSLKFKDGDGDLGLDESDRNFAPYNDYDFVFTNGEYTRYDEQKANQGSIPAFSCSYLIDTLIAKDKKKPSDLFPNDSIIDTILVKYNPHYVNFLLNVFVKKSGSYVPVVYNDSCFQSRDAFPRLKPIGYEGPLEGTLTTKLVKTIADLAKKSQLKFTVQIEDRKFHKSNLIEVEESF
jgi:hypothetical protein